MAIDTPAKRNAALKDRSGILFPRGAIDSADRQTLVGDYFLSSILGGLALGGWLGPQRRPRRRPKRRLRFPNRS